MTRLGGTRELLRTYNGTTTELPAVTTGIRLDFSKDIACFSHFFTLNNVENDEMSFFFATFALENLKRAPAKTDTHYFIRRVAHQAAQVIARGCFARCTRFFKTINEQRDIYDWRQPGNRISDGCRF